MPTRKQLISQIWIYRKRRANLTKKISQWQNQIKRIDVRNSKQYALQKAINDYFQVDIKTRIMDTKHKLARNCYYKYGMENGFEGVFLSKAIGRKRPSTASENRLKFTRSFKTNPQNKQAYHNFKNYIERK